ncbi:MAG: hypothetical protein ABRQ37_25955 [Candidatus Eremiobacterota bacterium]
MGITVWYLYHFLINFTIIHTLALPAWRSSEKNLNWNSHICYELTSCPFTLYFIQIDLCRRDIFFSGAPVSQRFIDSQMVLSIKW